MSKTLAAWPARFEALKQQVVKLAQSVEALERQFEALENRPKRRRSRCQSSPQRGELEGGELS